MRKDVFKAGEISEICRVSRQTVNRWLNIGELQGYRPTKNAVWRITRKELIKFMDNNRIPLDFLKEDKIKILIVDDDVNLVLGILRALREEVKFVFESAYSGFSAGTKLENFKPDIVILDIFLGDMDGREFFTYIRQNPELNNTKVIGISGKLFQEEIKQALEMGFDSFLEKPFDMENLKKEIFQVYEK